MNIFMGQIDLLKKQDCSGNTDDNL
jgi:hypothetical protein